MKNGIVLKDIDMIHVLRHNQFEEEEMLLSFITLISNGVLNLLNFLKHFDYKKSQIVRRIT